jgi:hypothetical protein
MAMTQGDVEVFKYILQLNQQSDEPVDQEEIGGLINLVLGNKQWHLARYLIGEGYLIHSDDLNDAITLTDTPNDILFSYLEQHTLPEEELNRLLRSAAIKGNLPLVKKLIELEARDLEGAIHQTQRGQRFNLISREVEEYLTNLLKKEQSPVSQPALPPNLERLTIPVIKDLLRQRNIYFPSRARKAELLELLRQSGGP